MNVAAGKSSRAEAEARVNEGLRELWYPVVPSWQLGPHPVGITRLGQDIVIWRNDAGSPVAIEDRCPHRGARLSLGCANNNHIACWYHGVEVGADGAVVNVPAVATSYLTGRKLLKSYPAIEIAGAVFLWFGEGEPKQLEVPEQLVHDDYSGFLCTATWHCNYRYAHDNLMDLMHGAYLHAASHSMSGGNKTAEMEVVDSPHGFVFRKTDQAGANFDWVEFADTGAHWMRTTVPYGKGAGPGGPFWIVGMVAPVTTEYCQVFFWRLRKVSGWSRAAWRFLYRTRLEKRHWHVLEQDRRVLEGLTGNARARENLYEHDAGVIRLRRQLTTAANEELRLEELRKPNKQKVEAHV